MLNTGSTLGTAVLRGIYVAVVAGLIAGITTYQTTDDEKAAILTGALAFLGALGVRGGIEGIADTSRQEKGKVLTSDVQPDGAGKAT